MSSPYLYMEKRRENTVLCDQACRSQPFSHLKVALFFQLCLFISVKLQNANIPFKTGDIHCYVTRCNSHTYSDSKSCGGVSPLLPMVSIKICTTTLVKYTL